MLITHINTRNNMESFILNALLVGLCLVCAMCPLGCVVLWKRMSYFADAVSHASLLGVVIGLLCPTRMNIIIILVSVLFAGILFLLRHEKSNDALITICSYSFLSLGLFLLVFIPHNNQIDLFSFLFGDILLISLGDAIFIFSSTAALLIWLYFRWKQLLLIAVNEDLAVIEGVNVQRVEFEFMMIMAFFTALSIGIVGVLLIVALLVIPASAARNFSSSGGQMLVFSVIIGAISLLIGVAASYNLDTPSGPSIVLVSAAMFIISLIYKRVKIKFL